MAGTSTLVPATKGLVQHQIGRYSGVRAFGLVVGVFSERGRTGNHLACLGKRERVRRRHRVVNRRGDFAVGDGVAELDLLWATRSLDAVRKQFHAELFKFGEDSRRHCELMSLNMLK